MTLSHELIIVFVLKNLLKIHPLSFHIKDNVIFQIKGLYLLSICPQKLIS